MDPDSVKKNSVPGKSLTINLKKFSFPMHLCVNITDPDPVLLIRIRIQGNDTYPTDPDPQHFNSPCFYEIFCLGITIHLL